MPASRTQINPTVVNTSGRNWVRSLFHDHPGKHTGNPNAFRGSGSSQKVKVYCKLCFEVDLAQLQARDAELVQTGDIIVAREREMLEAERELTTSVSNLC